MRSLPDEGGDGHPIDISRNLLRGQSSLAKMMASVTTRKGAEMKVRTWLFMAIVTVAVLGLELTSRASGEPPTPEPPLSLAASDVEKPPPGLQTSLYHRWRLATEVPAVPAADASVSAQYLSPVQVEILAAKDKVAEAIAAVERQGGSIQLTFENLIQAVVPPQTLLGLSQEPSILAVREPARLEPLVTTEGAGVIGTAGWHQAGITGQGVKVGVIDSFAGYQTLLGTELPPSEQSIVP